GEPQSIRHSSRTASLGATPARISGKGAAPGFGGNIPDAAHRLGPARPARSHLIRVPDQADVTRTGAPHGSHLAQAASLVNHYRSGTPAKTAASYSNRRIKHQKWGPDGRRSGPHPKQNLLQCIKELRPIRGGVPLRC